MALTLRVLQPGEQLDHYRIEGFVARGGMASIYRATDTRTGAPVAIKIPHPEVECDPAFFERFRREASIGRELDHPGLVKVLPDFPGKIVYFAAEWAEGRTLREIMDRQGKLPPERAIAIALAICDLLEYLTSQGIGHRDLKPENIVISEDGLVRLLDFGLASKSGARRLTFGKFSKIMGSPDYISPEQLCGKRGGASSDIYALGVIICEMLTGAAPFAGINLFVAMSQRLHTKPELAGVPQQLRAIVRCALDRDPARRYRCAADFAADLRDPDASAYALRAAYAPQPRKTLLFSLAMIPAAILVMLLIAAYNQ